MEMAAAAAAGEAPAGLPRAKAARPAAGPRCPPRVVTAERGREC